MKSINWEIIQSNIHEALEELEKLATSIKSSAKPDEIELELSLRHVYHHLNFAWNTRGITSEQYANLNDSDFKKWGVFPKGFDTLEQFRDPGPDL